jgi:hypothetical protein
MNQQTFDAALRAFCRRRPFKPYVVELQSGTRILVKHPEALGMRGLLAMFYGSDRLYKLFDAK